MKKTEKNKTYCESCKTLYDKNIFLFDYCPVCKGKRLKAVTAKFKRKMYRVI